MQTSPNIQHESTSKERKSGHAALIYLIITAVMFGGSILTCVLPQFFYPGGLEGLTTANLATVCWSTCLGIPLLILGLVFLYLAAKEAGKESK